MKRILVGLLVMFSPLFVNAQSNEVSAAFLLKTLEHMRWEGLKGEGDILISVVGDVSLEKTIAKKTIGLKVREKNVLVMPFDLAELGKYNLVYVANADAKVMHQIIAQAPGMKTVVVTQEEGTLTQGSFIRLMPAGDKIRFALNEKQFEDAGVMISSVIARLAVKAAP